MSANHTDILVRFIAAIDDVWTGEEPDMALLRKLADAGRTALTAPEAASALEASEAKNAALAAENATLRTERLNLTGSARHWKQRAEAAGAAIARAAEDERDRLLAVLADRPGSCAEIAREWLRDEGAMLPSARAALRQEAGRNG